MCFSWDLLHTILFIWCEIMTNANALLVTSQVGCSTPLKKNVSYFFFLILQWCGMVGRDGPAVWIVVRKVGRDTWREEMAKRLLLLFKSKMLRCVFRQKKTLQFQRKTHLQYVFFMSVYFTHLTRMEDLAHRHGEVTSGFEVLGKSGVVSRLVSPVGCEVIDPGCVWSAAG